MTHHYTKPAKTEPLPSADIRPTTGHTECAAVTQLADGPVGQGRSNTKQKQHRRIRVGTRISIQFMEDGQDLQPLHNPTTPKKRHSPQNILKLKTSLMQKP